MQILYGTTNSAKLSTMQGVTDRLGLKLLGLRDMPGPLPLIDESGKDPLENARIKAMAYYKAFGVPVFSCDSGLFFDELPPEQQPGVHVRRVCGRELTDEEMVAYYAALAQRHGGRLTARYRNAICFVYDLDHVYSSFDLSLATDPFYLVNKPFDKVREAGFPLDSLSVDISTGKYYYDQPQCTLGGSGAIMDGFTDFFKTVLLQLCKLNIRRIHMLTKEELIKVSYGALRIVEQDGYYFLRRFTEAQEEIIVPRLDMRRNDSAAGMRLEFTTCGGDLSFDYSAVKATGRNFHCFDIAVDGVLMFHFEEREHTKQGSIAFTIPCSEKPVIVTVYFSCYSSMGLKNVCLPEDYAPTARQLNLLALGDSITHGSDASYPSLSYANQVADHFGANMLNQAIGGDYFLDENLDPELPFAPDVITVAYGTNDWSRGSLVDNQMAVDYMNKLTATYPDKPVFLLLPVYRLDEGEERHGISLQNVRDRLAELGAQYPNVHVVDCKKFIPWLPGFYHDGYLHPNELGYMHYARGVIAAMEATLGK